MTNFYVVGTPIGNLADITLRALEILKSVDLVLCEDTRVTGKLLKHYEIKVPKKSYHANSTEKVHKEILEMIREGKTLALVSDAGTPTISDPGVMLVKMIRDELGDDVNIVSIPGASALTAGISIAGIPSGEFTFLGFLPHKKGRETLFREIAESERAVVFYESPHRILKALEALKTALNDERIVFVGRELTKMYEQGLKGSPTEIFDYYNQNPDKVRGEFLVIVSKK